jgi:hypothetical protein
MNTYDTDNRRLNVGTFWRNLRAVLRRWLDRERELVSLRNAVGMMSEARIADAAEWHEMRELNREMRADALRFRWLMKPHDHWYVRVCVRNICHQMPTRHIDLVRADIDANMVQR